MKNLESLNVTDFIEQNSHLTRKEIEGVINLASKKADELKNLVETKADFKEFINTEYKYANEGYLGGKSGVKKLQKTLILKGFLDNSNKVNGEFDEHTFFAILDYQRSDSSLVVDGLAGPRTQSSLYGSVSKNDKLTSYYRKQSVEKTFNYVATAKALHWLGDFSRDYSFESSSYNGTGFSSDFYSYPLEKYGNMTYCSRTARKNLYRLGVDKDNVAWGDSAISSMLLYKRPNYVEKITELPTGTNVLDLFVDTRSKYEHRAVAYLKDDGSWKVLDPYFENNNGPMDFDYYISKRKLIGVFAHEAKNVA